MRRRAVWRTMRGRALRALPMRRGSCRVCALWLHLLGLLGSMLEMEWRGVGVRLLADSS